MAGNIKRGGNSPVSLVFSEKICCARSYIILDCEHKIEEQNLELKSKAAELEERDDLIASQASRIRVLEESLAKAKASNPAVRLENDPPLFQHQFGGRMIWANLF